MTSPEFDETRYNPAGYSEQSPYTYPPPPASGYSPPPGYPPQPGYPAPGYAMYPQYPPTNTMATLSMVFAFVFAPLGIVFGHIARSQLRRTGEQGMGLATAGLICSYVFTGLSVLFCGVSLVGYGIAAVAHH